MHKPFLGLVLFAFCGLVAQTTLGNDSVMTLAKANLSEDAIVTIVSNSPGAYDTSADALIAMKNAGVTDRVISAVVLKMSTSKSSSQPSTSPPVPEPKVNGTLPDTLVAPATLEPTQLGLTDSQASSKPRVFLQSASKGTNRNAARDQSMEMSKDFEKDCPGVRVTINAQMADYTVLLNHIEVGLIRDNQIQVANKDGDLLSKTKEGGSIAKGSKKACGLIVADWAARRK